VDSGTKKDVTYASKQNIKLFINLTITLKGRLYRLINLTFVSMLMAMEDKSQWDRNPIKVG